MRKSQGSVSQSWYLEGSKELILLHQAGTAVARCGMPQVHAVIAERMICGLAARPLPAHHRGTRRKYVPVGSCAASMPLKVPRRWAGKDPSRWSVCIFQKSNRLTFWCGGLADCGTVGGMDAAIEPPGMGSRRVPRAARASRPRLARLGIVQMTPRRFGPTYFGLRIPNLVPTHNAQRNPIRYWRGTPGARKRAGPVSTGASCGRASSPSGNTSSATAA